MPPAITVSPRRVTPSRIYCTTPTSRSPKPSPSRARVWPLGKNCSLNVCLNEYSYLTDFQCFGLGRKLRCKGLGKPISRSTVWRILDTDAIKPWRYKYWIFPRDPHFAEKAGLLLDLYAGMWQGQPLGPHDHILSADEKTSIQARRRCHPSLPPTPGRPAYIENEYERGGALQYLAAWDVRQGYVMGRCEQKTGIAPFGRLVKQVLAEEPYRSGERLFWIVDNGSSHRGTAARKRLRHLDSRIILVHTPVHASWLNQVEIYFSIIQRKVLTPNDFADLEAVRLRLALYEELSNHHPTPFQWKFDRTKLAALLAKIEARQKALAEAQLNWLEEAA